jgi:hypothetical protein
MVINFGVKKLGCGESVGLGVFSAKYLKFSRQRDPHRLTDTLIRVGLGNLRFLQVHLLHVGWRNGE